MVPKREGKLVWSKTRDEKGNRERALWAEFTRPGGWLVRYRLEPQDGVPVVAEVQVLHTGKLPPGGLDSTTWRSVKLSEWRELWPDVLENIEKRYGRDALVERHLQRFGFGIEAKRSPRRPGRAGHSDAYYAQLADDYVALIAKGHTKPTKELARRAPFKGQPNAEQAARDAVHQARRRGLLTEAPAGRAGGELTEHAKEVLDERRKR